MILTNMNVETGIHFGVIPTRTLFNHAEEFYYQAKDITHAEIIDDIQEAITGLSDYLDEGTIEELLETATENFNDHYENDNARMVYEKDGYIIQGDCDDPDLFIINDLFIIKSPFYTYAPPCSPCAPGAGYLLDAITADEVDEHDEIKPGSGGMKTYCLPADWFEDNKSPYKYWKVKSNPNVPEAENV